MKTSEIYISQIDTKLCDLENNFNKLIANINKVNDNSILIFQRSFLVGFPLFQTLEKYPFLKNQEVEYIKKILPKTKNKTVIFGTVDGICIIENGEYKIISSNSTIKINGDIFKIISADEYDLKTSDLSGDYDILLLLVSSISRAGSEARRHEKLKTLSKTIKKPIINVNQTGSTDSLSFDGGSRVYNNNGELIACSKFFQEDFMKVDLNNKEKNQISHLQKVFNQNIENFTLDYSWDIERTYLSTIQTIKSYFNKNGFKRATLGLSGGLDSSVCAALLAHALGSSNVFGVSMPSVISSKNSVDDAKKLASNLGIHYEVKPIADMVNSASKAIDSIETDLPKYDKSYTYDNIQARSRATILWGISNKYQSTLTIATCDKSEDYMGYSTINGDMSGAFSPIGDITKTKTFALARFINRNSEIIPKEIIMKKPTAELAMNSETGDFLYAEEALMPYEFLDEIIWHFENSNLNIEEMMKIEFIYEKEHNISKNQKLQWLQKFFKRIQGALYKWTITPTFPITDKHSLNIMDGYHPISMSIPVNYLND